MTLGKQSHLHSANLGWHRSQLKKTHGQEPNVNMPNNKQLELVKKTHGPEPNGNMQNNKQLEPRPRLHHRQLHILCMNHQSHHQ